MSDIAASERRLSAALDRIDYLLENNRNRKAGEAAATEAALAEPALRTRLEEARAENTRLAMDLQTLHERQSSALQVALAEARDRLTGAGREAVRLAIANDELTAANRALIEAQNGHGDAVTAMRAALEAEIESLRAARAAEITQMGDIMGELERLLGPTNQSPDAPFATDVTDDHSGEVVSFNHVEAKSGDVQESVSESDDQSTSVANTGDEAGVPEADSDDAEPAKLQETANREDK